MVRHNGIVLDEYRRARDALLAEEIELRRHIERVAAQRRALPPGGVVPKDYRFEGESGPVGFSELFGDKQTLAVYSFMYGPKRERPCPMCNVFTRRDGTLRHFWSGEMGPETADPGQDPRGAPDLMPLWTILDSTPEGRGTDWYPRLEYAKQAKK
jgi:predicted dithiol-disulfide oxidoreductase (DUF899 family)